jgi:hypothetical protein
MKRFSKTIAHQSCSLCAPTFPGPLLPRTFRQARRLAQRAIPLGFKRGSWWSAACPTIR